MNRRRQFHLLLIAAVAAVIAASGADRALFGADAAADAKKRRAENERKSQEIKKKVEEQQRAVRERLGLPDRAGAVGTATGASATTTTTLSGPSSAAELRKKLNLPEAKSAVRGPGKSTTAFGMTKTTVAYAPKRGQEFAFLVEILAREAGMQKQWIGKPYFAATYSSSVQPPFAEVLCIGSLTSRIRSSADRPWTAASTEDIEFPQTWLFGSSGALGGETTSLFDEPTLPLQLSAILPLEELIFPRLPLFSDNPADESTRSSRYYVRGGKSNLRYSPITDLDGEIHRVCRVEDENSATPRIVNERSFSCPDKEISFSLRQVGVFDAKEGMILSVDIDYLLELEGKVPAKVKVRRLYGDDLATARAEALQKLPPSKWPARFRRIQADPSEFNWKMQRSAGEIPVGQRVSVSIAGNERNAKGSRDYLARTIDGGPEKKVRVRLDGSGEELDVSPSSIRLPK